MIVNLSNHTYIIYTYTALFYHRILRYLIFFIIYNPLEIYFKKNRFKISIRNCWKENQWWLKLSNRSIIRDLQIWKESRSKINICQVCIKFTKLVCSSLLFIRKWLSEKCLRTLTLQHSPLWIWWENEPTQRIQLIKYELLASSNQIQIVLFLID